MEPTQAGIRRWWILTAIFALPFTFFLIRVAGSTSEAQAGAPTETHPVSQELFAQATDYARTELTGPPEDPEPQAEIETRWSELHGQWMKALSWQEGWLYRAMVIEYRGDMGTDPETGWPLPNQALWEEWFLRGENDVPVSRSVLRRTDLERGNVWTYSWLEGIYVNHVTGTRYPDEGPYQFDFAADLGCFSALGNHPQRTLSAEWRREDGVSLYAVILRKNYRDPIQGIDDDPRAFVASETLCSREAETGAPVRIERVIITEAGERVVMDRVYDYQIQAGSTPPAALLALFEQR